MKKVCILGNSHIGALIRGMNTLPEKSEFALTHKVDFFRGEALQSNLYYEKGLLKPKNGNASYYLHKESGKHHIDLSAYDCVISYGGRLMANPDGWVNHVKDYVSDRYSSAVLRQSHIDDLESAQATLLFQAIANSDTYTGKLIVMPSPIPNEKYWGFNPLKIVIPAYMDYVEGIYTEYFSTTPISFAALPRDLLGESGYGLSTRFKVNREGDFMHLNDEGGAIVAKNLLSLLTYID